MWSVVVVIFHPFFGNFPKLIEIFEDVCVQYILAESTIEPFDVRILHGTSRLDILNDDPVLRAPIHKDRAGELRAIVNADFNRYTVFANRPFQHSDYRMAWEAEVSFYYQCLPVVIVNHIEYPEPSFIHQGIVHEIHRPAHVTPDGYCGPAYSSIVSPLRGSAHRVYPGRLCGSPAWTPAR